jgi:hypothetical protein
VHQSWKSNVESGSNRFILENGLRTVPGRFPKILYVLPGAGLRRSFHTVVSFRFGAVSHQWLRELRGVSNFPHVQYSSTRRFHPTTNPQLTHDQNTCVWVRCHLCSQCWTLIMKKRRFAPRSCATCSTYSGSIVYLTLVPKSELYYGIPGIWVEGSNGDHQKSTSKTC